MIGSLSFMLWIGFGAQVYKAWGWITVAKKAISVEGCPADIRESYLNKTMYAPPPEEQ